MTETFTVTVRINGYRQRQRHTFDTPRAALNYVRQFGTPYPGVTSPGSGVIDEGRLRSEGRLVGGYTITVTYA